LIKEVVRCYIKQQQRQQESLFVAEDEASPPPKGDDNDFDAMMDVNLLLLTRASLHKRAKVASKLDIYLDEGGDNKLQARLHPTLNHASLLYRCPIRWWQQVGQQRFPLLYKIALNYLGIPSTSCECERCFS
jgi:hypothetical protein